MYNSDRDTHTILYLVAYVFICISRQSGGRQRQQEGNKFSRVTIP